ncbi:hypothetical protein FEP75_05716 [Burkholderia multivorans]|nr:hypothetical protein [Burkholderia multivorans]MDR8939219.1 hypothetical protein [Burkholderia multivorans]
MRVHHELSVPSNVISTWIVPRMPTPNTDPITYPTPPVSSVPPITVAAIASSSIPCACSPYPDSTYSVKTTPPSAEQKPLSA